VLFTLVGGVQTKKTFFATVHRHSAETRVVVIFALSGLRWKEFFGELCSKIYFTLAENIDPSSVCQAPLSVHNQTV
jgi:hypothetical protein